MQKIDSRQVYENNWMTVREDRILHPDGSPGIYGVVDKPDYALVIPLDGDRLHLVEQFRYPLGQRRWEFPQGTAPDRVELDQQELAARELREETGLRAGQLTNLGMLDVAPGLSSQRGRVFLATDLTEGPHEREH
jgi:8-oxo-dGTP pyrophosphatase MutT (NUDIX family)